MEIVLTKLKPLIQILPFLLIKNLTIAKILHPSLFTAKLKLWIQMDINTDTLYSHVPNTHMHAQAYIQTLKASTVQ